MTLIRRPGLRRPGGPKASTALPLTAANFELAKTWLSTIAEACLTDPEWHQEGDERKYRHTGGLSINMKGRGWYDHSAQCGGSSAIKLICHLKGCSYKDAAQWLTAFLAASPGAGPCAVGDGGAVDDDDTSPASAAECREVLANCRDLTGTASEVPRAPRTLPGRSTRSPRRRAHRRERLCRQTDRTRPHNRGAAHLPDAGRREIAGQAGAPTS
jgi:hypothetical protein